MVQKPLVLESGQTNETKEMRKIRADHMPTMEILETGEI